MKKIMTCCRFNFFQWKRNPRVICVLLLLLGYIYSVVEPISKFSGQAGVKCTPWIFPLITCDANSVLVFLILLVILLCDAPFLYPYQKYTIIRAGKTVWILAQMLYIAITALLFWMFVAISSALLLFPNITFSSEWGKVLGTLAQAPLGGASRLSFPIYYKLMLDFSPMQAFLTGMLLAWFVSFFLGLVILYFNMSRQKSLGIILAFVFILLQHFAYMASGYWVYKISPVSWLSMNLVNFTHRQTEMPGFLYVMVSLFFLCTFFVFLILKKMAKKSIDLVS